MNWIYILDEAIFEKNAKKLLNKKDRRSEPSIVTNNRFGGIEKQIIPSILIHNALMEPENEMFLY